MNISVILVTYNSQNFILNCLESLYQSLKNIKTFEVIIFDNNTNDNNIEYNFENLKVINSNINLGLSKALNIAISSSKYDTILTLNPDVILKEGSIDVLYKHFSDNKNIGVIGCKVEDFSGKYQLYSKRRFPHFLIAIPYFLKLHKIGFINHYNYNNINNDKICYVDSISGCCMMFSRHAYDSVSGFNEKYFLYFEDTQFCVDIKNIDMDVCYMPLASIQHYGGGSSESIPIFF